YQTYQAITQALQERDPKLLQAVLQNYQTTNTEMDTTISTFRKNQQAVINSTKYEFSNGPLEGINRKIKTLKRTCYGFA
ncbi:transposase, partial [Limosilactobacillus fastidiosus]